MYICVFVLGKVVCIPFAAIVGEKGDYPGPALKQMCSGRVDSKGTAMQCHFFAIHGIPLRSAASRPEASNVLIL